MINTALVQPAFTASYMEYSIRSSPSGPTGESCFMPPLNRVPRPAARISSVFSVIIISLFSFPPLSDGIFHIFIIPFSNEYVNNAGSKRAGIIQKKSLDISSQLRYNINLGNYICYQRKEGSIIMAVKKIRMSAEGFKDLEKQLEYLKNVRRAEVAQKLKEARSFGDLSENAEYDEAKNEQAILEAEIVDIEMKISNAEVVNDEDLSTDEIGVGSYVKLKDLEFDEILELQIVGSTEADPENNKISEDAPIGVAALKKKVGDILEVEAPMGIIKMEVLEISK